MRQDLNVRLDGVQGTLTISAQEREGDAVVWVTAAYGDDPEGVSIGVTPADLRSAISFVLGDYAAG